VKPLSDRLAIVIATGIYTGYCPIVPGTVGTVTAIPFFLLLSRLDPLIYGVATVIVFLLGVWSSGRAEGILMRKDAPPIVIDEIVGFLVTMFLVPLSVTYVVLGFFFFRLFDIVKPYPASLMNDKVKGGWGVVLDDLFAGVYANLCIQAIRLGLNVFGMGT